MSYFIDHSKKMKNIQFSDSDKHVMKLLWTQKWLILNFYKFNIKSFHLGNYS